MAADFAMGYDSVKQLAKEIGDIHHDFAGMIQTLGILVDSLDGQWVGTAHDEFVAAYKKLRPKLNTISSVMGNYESAIRRGSDRQFEVDNDLSKRYRGIHGNMDEQHSEAGVSSHGETIGKETANNQSNDAIQLAINMGSYSTCQHDYAIKNKYGKNVGCCATAYAVGLSIVKKHAYYPADYWYAEPNKEETTHFKDGGVGDYIKLTGDNVEQRYAKEIIANLNVEDISNGKPTMIHYGYSGGQHWVLALGVKPGIDPSNATMSDIIIMDPNTGEICNWDERLGAPNTSMWGIQKFS